jgi:hypothetical protein
MKVVSECRIGKVQNGFTKLLENSPTTILKYAV